MLNVLHNGICLKDRTRENLNKRRTHYCRNISPQQNLKPVGKWRRIWQGRWRFPEWRGMRATPDRSWGRSATWRTAHPPAGRPRTALTVRQDLASSRYRSPCTCTSVWTFRQVSNCWYTGRLAKTLVTLKAHDFLVVRFLKFLGGRGRRPKILRLKP